MNNVFSYSLTSICYYSSRWYENQHFEEFGISRKQLLVAYFLAAATIFEPEKGKERILWAKSQLISKMIRTIFDQEHSREKRSALLKDFSYNINCSRKLNRYSRLLIYSIEIKCYFSYA